MGRDWKPAHSPSPVRRTCPGLETPVSSGEILKDVGGLHPVLEAGQPPLADLLPPFVCDDLPTGFHNHQPGGDGDVVPGPQLTAGEKREGRAGSAGEQVVRGDRGLPEGRPADPAKPQPPTCRHALLRTGLLFTYSPCCGPALSQGSVRREGAALDLSCPN